MTREEKAIALYCLKASSDYHSEVCEECIKYPNCDHTIQDDVTETIIKALEQMSSEDCVSRQAMLKEIPRLWNSRGDKDYCMETLRDFVTELPPVTPTRKVGHWIDSEILGEFKCSYCGNYWQDAEENEYEDWVNIAKYCPNCGAEMESEE